MQRAILISLDTILKWLSEWITINIYVLSRLVPISYIPKTGILRMNNENIVCYYPRPQMIIDVRLGSGGSPLMRVTITKTTADGLYGVVLVCATLPTKR